jgi:hypothetical protein
LGKSPENSSARRGYRRGLIRKAWRRGRRMGDHQWVWHPKWPVLQRPVQAKRRKLIRHLARLHVCDGIAAGRSRAATAQVGWGVLPAKAGIQYAPALRRALFRQRPRDYWIPTLASRRSLGRNDREFDGVRGTERWPTRNFGTLRPKETLPAPKRGKVGRRKECLSRSVI